MQIPTEFSVWHWHLYNYNRSGISHFSVVREVLTWGCGDAKNMVEGMEGGELGVIAILNMMA